MTTAVGADALFGMSIEEPSDLYSIGHPALFGAVVTNPAAKATAAAGAAGNLTGKFHWRYSWADEAGALTYPSPGTDAALTVPVGTPSLDDATFSGTFTLPGAAPMFEVEIDTDGTPDKFKWRINDGVTAGLWTEEVSITGAAQLLGYGISVAFNATTGHLVGDAWYRESALELTDKKGGLTSVANGGTGAVKKVIERTDDYGNSWAICGTIFDNTTTTFTDDLAALDTSKVLPSMNQTGTNYGFLFVDVDSFDIDADFTTLQSQGLKGSAGRPRGIPGPIKVSGAPKGDVRAAYLEPLLDAGCGKATPTELNGGAVKKRVWIASTARRTPRTISAFTSDGSKSVPPTLLTGLACEELTLSFSGGKIVDTAFKLTGSNYASGAPAAQSGGTGTWAGAFVALGSRYDAAAADPDPLVSNLYLKITEALGIGTTVKFKTKVGFASTYDGAEYTLYTNAVSGKQTKGGAQFNDGIELFDENDLALGADIGSNRQPFLLYAVGGDLADLDVDDVFTFPLTALIPGPVSGDSPEQYSGVPAQYVDGPRFTDAHVTITKDGSVLEAETGSVKLTFPKKEVNALCAGARSLQDLVNDGYFGCEVTFTRPLKDAEWRDMMKTDDRAVVRVSLTGERIPLSQGALSTYRESFVVDVPQFMVKSTKAPKANQSSVVETVVGEAEQPDNTALDLFTLTLYTRQGWRVPA